MCGNGADVIDLVTKLVTMMIVDFRCREHRISLMVPIVENTFQYDCVYDRGVT